METHPGLASNVVTWRVRTSNPRSMLLQPVGPLGGLEVIFSRWCLVFQRHILKPQQLIKRTTEYCSLCVITAWDVELQEVTQLTSEAVPTVFLLGLFLSLSSLITTSFLPSSSLAPFLCSLKTHTHSSLPNLKLWLWLANYALTFPWQ